jgi:hypothetical protein
MESIWVVHEATHPPDDDTWLVACVAATVGSKYVIMDAIAGVQNELLVSKVSFQLDKRRVQTNHRARGDSGKGCQSSKLLTCLPPATGEGCRLMLTGFYATAIIWAIVLLSYAAIPKRVSLCANTGETALPKELESCIVRGQRRRTSVSTTAKGTPGAAIIPVSNAARDIPTRDRVVHTTYDESAELRFVLG